MENFPTLESHNLKLRKLELSDIPYLIQYANNKNISDQIFNIPFPYEEIDAIFRFNFILQGFKNKERFVFAITKRETGEFIGEIGLHLEISNKHAQFGYGIAQDFWNLGFATEATKLVLAFGFNDLDLHKIYATHFPENEASAKVMIKNKMVKEAEMKDHFYINGAFKSIIQYRITKKEYFSY